MKKFLMLTVAAVGLLNAAKPMNDAVEKPIFNYSEFQKISFEQKAERFNLSDFFAKQNKIIADQNVTTELKKYKNEAFESLKASVFESLAETIQEINSEFNLEKAFHNVSLKVLKSLKGKKNLNQMKALIKKFMTIELKKLGKLDKAQKNALNKAINQAFKGHAIVPVMLANSILSQGLSKEQADKLQDLMTDLLEAKGKGVAAAQTAFKNGILEILSQNLSTIQQTIFLSSAELNKAKIDSNTAKNTLENARKVLGDKPSEEQLKQIAEFEKNAAEAEKKVKEIESFILGQTSILEASQYAKTIADVLTQSVKVLDKEGFSFEGSAGNAAAHQLTLVNQLKNLKLHNGTEILADGALLGDKVAENEIKAIVEDTKGLTRQVEDAQNLCSTCNREARLAKTEAENTETIFQIECKNAEEAKMRFDEAKVKEAAAKPEEVEGARVVTHEAHEAYEAAKLQVREAGSAKEEALQAFRHLVDQLAVSEEKITNLKDRLANLNKDHSSYNSYLSLIEALKNSAISN